MGIGTRPEEVASCTSALLTLLEPFQWASAFIPLIPYEYLDFVSSPVPFIAGYIAEDVSNLEQIFKDVRVIDAISDGMIALNLDNGSMLSSSKFDQKKIVAFSQSVLIHQRIDCY